MPQHKHVTVELLRLPPESFAAELSACAGRGTTLARNDPTGMAVSAIETSLTGSHMLHIKSLVPSLPRDADQVTIGLAEAAFARAGAAVGSTELKWKNQVRDRVVSFTAYPDLDGYVESITTSVPTWCLLLANSHSEFDMAVDVRLMAPSASWDKELVPFNRPVIVRTDSFVAIKLVEAQVLPDGFHIVVEWFHARSTFTLGAALAKPIVKMQIDTKPYVVFDVLLETTSGQVTDKEALRVAQQEARMALDLAVEEFETGQLLIPTTLNVHDKISLARSSFRSILQTRHTLRQSAAAKKEKHPRPFTSNGTAHSVVAPTVASAAQLSSAFFPTRKQRLKLGDPILRSVSRDTRSFTKTLGSAGQQKPTARAAATRARVLAGGMVERQPMLRSGGLDATLAPVVYPPPPTLIPAPNPQPGALFSATGTAGKDGRAGAQGHAAVVVNTSTGEVIDLMSDDVAMGEGEDEDIVVLD